MTPRLVTVATFNQPIEAHVVKGRLESEGIETFLADEHVISMNPFYSNAVGGVKVQVAEEDVEEALKILGTDVEESS